MIIESGYSLQAHNSFGFDVSARFFASAGSEDDVREALSWASDNGQSLFPLGGGSNTVMVSAPAGLVLHINILGVEHRVQDDDRILLRVGAGEDWSALVAHTVAQGWFGLENLALIPGLAGAAPVQNIGAYGVELADVLVSVEAIDRDSGGSVSLSAEQCGFAYRHSAFKGEWAGRYIITQLWLQLSTVERPVVSYPALRAALPDPDHPSARAVFETVVSVRSRRLPAPAGLGNAGSFFTNPLVDDAALARLLAAHPELPHWPSESGRTKLSAGWLVEQCGWKGFRDGQVGVYPHQALVLVNHGGGTGAQILQLARDITESVHQRFGVALEIEPQLVGA